MTLYLATENKGKLHEMRALFAASLPQLQLQSVADLPPEVRGNYVAEETGKTYAENALIKAYALRRILPDAGDALVLSEDSGFEVEALGGAPGVYSARYEKTDQARCAKILRALEIKTAEQRRAKFVACVALIDQRNHPTLFFGRKEGFVAESASGDKGFGYDPIFSPVFGGPTWGELGEDAKNNDSHRSRALSLVIQYLIVRGSQNQIKEQPLL